MITIKTLPQATAQQVFDQVKKHLLTQNCRATNEIGQCKYRGNHSTKCAAGCLIGNKEYTTVFENNSWGRLVQKGLVPNTHLNLINTLQVVHDSYSVEEWETELNNVASRYNLNS